MLSIKVGHSGWPDRLFLLPGGGTLWVEFKVPGRRPGLRQQARMQVLRDWGQRVEWVDSEEGFREVLALCMLIE